LESVTVFRAGSHTRGNIAKFLTGGWPATGRVSVWCFRQISTKRRATPVSGFRSSLLPGKTEKETLPPAILHISAVFIV